MARVFCELCGRRSGLAHYDAHPICGGCVEEIVGSLGCGCDKARKFHAGAGYCEEPPSDQAVAVEVATRLRERATDRATTLQGKLL